MVVFDNYFPSIGQSFTCVKVTFELRRKPRYFWLNIIIPCLLLNGIGLGVFILPVGSGEKVSFGLGILLTVFVFAILVNEYIPKTSDYTSVLGKFIIHNVTDYVFIKTWVPVSFIVAMQMQYKSIPYFTLVTPTMNC